MESKRLILGKGQIIKPHTNLNDDIKIDFSSHFTKNGTIPHVAYST